MATWNLSNTRHHVLICNGGSCMRGGAEAVTQAIREEIRTCGADGLIHTTRTRCNGRCDDACVVIVYPEGVWYQGMTPESGRQMVQEHLLGGSPVLERAVYTYGGTGLAPTGSGREGVSK
ncbi:(2Fe-2S) ferredoxin domain-containing protein [Paenibacillus mucilaginosus]|uniref:CbiW n=2 Tax=Paenibacillus mucilaginosus TaxID=61624 RepID=F8FG50_PAEMK|nr:(2Fe-2S) ferredoxin domain-containing protein [Paenibacillus mucilaginosus]AEI43870.1 CbiW [Paenibacillus mucilaginosus KNP414]MCG7212621.1 (2Fe-2S) ferredoxin domain-containing protein [Paenibacillus mucilaginosus]WDM25356.1 (2Fe-2S) ferredoxin domain-containing protein [Paenibacillus mucilaginosus]